MNTKTYDELQLEQAEYNVKVSKVDADFYEKREKSNLFAAEQEVVRRGIETLLSVCRGTSSDFNNDAKVKEKLKEFIAALKPTTN